MFFYNKQKIDEEYIRKIKMSVDELKQGKEEKLSMLYQALANSNIEIKKYLAKEISCYVRKLNSYQIIRLEEHFREWSSMEWRVSWEKLDLSLWKTIIDNGDEYLWMLRLGTFHPNGYFREKCINNLCFDRNSFKYILLRLNDWALPVRNVAQRVILQQMKELDIEGILSCLIYLKKVKNGNRKDNEIINRVNLHFVNVISQNIQSINLNTILSYDYFERKYIYQFLLENKIVTNEQVMRLVKKEKYGQCQLVIMKLFTNNYKVSIDEIDECLQNRSKIVQRKAIEYKYNILKDAWDGMEELLLSGSASVREYTRYVLLKHTDINVLEYYIERLETSKKKIAILGIGESGDVSDAERIIQYLHDSDESVVKSVLIAVSKLLKSDADVILWKHLYDRRLVVQRAAYSGIVKNNIKYGAKKVYNLLNQTDSLWLKEKLTYQLFKEDYWHMLPFALQMYCDENEIVREIVRCKLERQSVYLYGKITKEEAEMIKAILYDEKYEISPQLRKKIEFDLKFVVN